MEHKAARIVMCIAVALTAVITLWGKSMDGIFLPRTLTDEQVMRECSELIISQTEQDIIDQIWADQEGYGYDRRELDRPTRDALGVPDSEAFAQIAPGADGPASDYLYIVCWTNGGGQIVYEVSAEFYNKTISPAGRNVIYSNQNNTVYQKYTNQVLWPWSDV